MSGKKTSKQNDSAVLTESVTELAKPSMYHVVLLNDDYTPMNFVIELLMGLFQKDYQQAYDITLEVHHQERGIAGTFSYEIATEKAKQVVMSAKANDFPLQCSLEKA